MIWYFLAGVIAGAVGWHKMIRFYGERIQQERKLRELKGEDNDRD